MWISEVEGLIGSERVPGAEGVTRMSDEARL
jgi:hypothetical protein